jgi:hypothetical protein
LFCYQVLDAGIAELGGFGEVLGQAIDYGLLNPTYDRDEVLLEGEVDAFRVINAQVASSWLVCHFTFVVIGVCPIDQMRLFGGVQSKNR